MVKRHGRGRIHKRRGVRVIQQIPDHSPHNTTSHIPPKQSRIYAGTSNLFAVGKRIHAYITMLSSGHTEGLYNCVSYCGNGINPRNLAPCHSSKTDGYHTNVFPIYKIPSFSVVCISISLVLQTYESFSISSFHTPIKPNHQTSQAFPSIPFHPVKEEAERTYRSNHAGDQPASNIKRVLVGISQADPYFLPPFAPLCVCVYVCQGVLYFKKKGAREQTNKQP